MHQDEQNWDLIAGKLHNELDPEENARFEKAMEEPLNKKFLAKGEKIQKGIKESQQLFESDQNDSWEHTYRKIRVRTIGRYGTQILKYAAVLLLAFVAGYYYQSMNRNQNVQFADIEVMYGQTGHLFLFDGTEVWLNSGSKFKYPNQFNQNERDVYLEGEAFFKVAKNKHLPFKVKTGNLEVEVLGTSFNVSAYPGEPDQTVVLVEGKVQLNNREGAMIGQMNPGQVAVKTTGDRVIHLKNADPYFYTSWKDGKVVFDGEKLGEIAKKMERWYNVEIRFEKESLKEYHFSGTILRNKPIDQTILAMEMLAPIRFKYEVKTQEKNVIIIERVKR